MAARELLAAGARTSSLGRGGDRLKLELASGTAAADRAVANLFVAYFYEMAGWDPGIVMNEFGLPVWKDFGLPGPGTPEECIAHNWWIRDRCARYAIRLGGAAVGFAIVCKDLTALPYEVPGDVDFELLDFYVAPKARRRRVGEQAAALVFERHRGNGLLFTLEENRAAQEFWRSTLPAYARDVQEADGGTSFRFRT